MDHKGNINSQKCKIFYYFCDVMFDLIYPQPVMPLLGEATGGQEMVPVVKPSGEVVGRASRETVHATHLLHPVVRLNIVDRNGNFFLQKRSMTKKVFPGMWDSACAGHVGYGETLSEALRREVAEELDFYEYNPIFLGKYTYDGGETELVTVFAAVGNFDLHPCNDEVDEGRWWTPGEIEKNIGKGVFSPGLEDDWEMYKDKMLALL